VAEGEMQDNIRNQELKERNNQYVNRLRGQIVEGQEKKRYGELMTEHERLVNDRDIKAYEDMDTHNLYGKLPGFGGVHEAQRQK
jgi:hypothetical protein